MANVSKELSIDYNRKPVGEHGGRGPRDLNNPGENRLERQHAPDGINPPNKLGNPGSPDKDLFDSSKP